MFRRRAGVPYLLTFIIGIIGISIITLIYLFLGHAGNGNTTGFPEDYSIESVKISLATGGAGGPVMISKTAIFGDGTVKSVLLLQQYKMHGSKFGEGKISKEEVKRLLNVFKENRFFSLKESYENRTILDLPANVVSLNIDGIKKSVYVYGTEGPPQLQNIIEKINEAVQKIKFNETNNSSVCEIFDNNYNRYECYCQFYIKRAIVNKEPEACEAIKKIQKPAEHMRACYDNCYLELAFDTNSAKFCTKIEDSKTRERCANDLARIAKDENICDLLSNKEDILECYGEVSKLSNSPYTCLTLEDKGYKAKDIITCIIYSNWNKKELSQEPSCEKFTNSVKRDLCYYIAKDCNSISSWIEYGHGYRYTSVKEVCIVENIGQLWGRYGLEKAVDLCKEVSWYFYQNICLSNLAFKIKEVDKDKAIEICNMISEEKRRNMCLDNIMQP